jgi:hypothetical protein
MANNIPLTVGEVVEAATANTWARGYLRKSTAKTVNTTTAATDLLNGEFTLPGGALGTDKIARLTMSGTFKQNVATNKKIPRFQLLLGGTTLIDTGTPVTALADQLNQEFGWKFVCEIQNLGATNSQQAYLTGHLGCLGDIATPTQIGFTIGNGIVAYGAPSGPGSSALTVYDGGAVSGIDFTAVDTTASCAVVFNVINGFSNANYETKLLGALVEII